MSPRYERLVFRLALVGLVLVVGVFVYRTVVNPIGPGAALPTTTTTTVPGDTTTSTTAAPEPRTFAILTPRDKVTVANGTILLAGVGNPGAVVARAEIATTVDARGVWSLSLPLATGLNDLALTETATDGKTQTASIGVIFQG